MPATLQPGCQLGLLLVLLAVGSCGAEEQPERAGLTHVYRCSDQQRFVVRFEPHRAWIFVGEKTLSVPQIPAASGMLYTAGDVTFRARGREATLQLGDVRHDACVLVPTEAPWEEARLRGVDFRATGDAEAWTLEIRDGQDVVFVPDAGKTRNEAHHTPPQVLPGSSTRVYEFDGSAGPFRATLNPTTDCSGATADEQLTTRVSIEWNGRTFLGCGRFLH